MSKKKQPKIQFKIFNIKRVSHFENNFKDFGLNPKDIESGSVEINVKMGVNEKTNKIIFNVDVKFFIDKNKKRVDLFGVGTIHTFEVKNMNNVFLKDENNKFIFPDNFMFTMLNTVVGSTRGILVLSRTNLEYLNIYLPAINIKKLLTSVESIKTKDI